jgi:hypothetical protein
MTIVRQSNINAGIIGAHFYGITQTILPVVKEPVVAKNLV